MQAIGLNESPQLLNSVVIIISVHLANLPSNIKWIIGNVGQFGYYRMNYDTETWENIIQQLKINHQVFEYL